MPQIIKFFYAKDKKLPRIERKYAVKTDSDITQINA